LTAISIPLGILLLVIATGAGAAICQSLGNAVLGGMIVSTVLSLLFICFIFLLPHFCVNLKDDCRSFLPEKQLSKKEIVAVGNGQK